MLTLYGVGFWLFCCWVTPNTFEREYTEKFRAFFVYAYLKQQILGTGEEAEKPLNE